MQWRALRSSGAQESSCMRPARKGGRGISIIFLILILHYYLYYYLLKEAGVYRGCGPRGSLNHALVCHGLGGTLNHAQCVRGTRNHAQCVRGTRNHAQCVRGTRNHAQCVRGTRNHALPGTQNDARELALAFANAVAPTTASCVLCHACLSQCVCVCVCALACLCVCVCVCTGMPAAHRSCPTGCWHQTTVCAP
jgi:hypothetical protein